MDNYRDPFDLVAVGVWLPIKEVMGEGFSAKDFRTWAGTLVCACALARAGIDLTDTTTSKKRKIGAAIKETAETLGNTPAVCRSAYICPAVLDSFERGKVIDATLKLWRNSSIIAAGICTRQSERCSVCSSERIAVTVGRRP